MPFVQSELGMVLEGTERELVAACQAGDRDAFRALFELHKDRVYSIALRFTGEPADAMDIAQDSFLKLFSGIRQFRGHSSLETFIYRLVVNSCLDRKRKDRRLLPLVDEWAATLRDRGASPCEELLRSERRAHVQTAIAKLAPGLRMVIVLRYTEGLAYDRIAEVLGCSPGTVASRLNRAHKTLERRLAPWAREQGGHYV
ncbi:MAG: sigma-70 family RNA polymerase sigma factor [Acidobacteriia bacterium]|nr:sigma-70 family RNA polymerase sigma factor [Terriglobia bacterium]